MEGAKINEAKVRLAFEITKLVHGQDEAQKAQNTAAEIFKKVRAVEMNRLVELDSAMFEGGAINVLDLLVQAKITTTKSEARRLVDQGGLSIDQKKSLT